MAATQASSLLEVHSRLIRRLERDGEIDREIEFLPGAEELAERLAAQEGLHAPELSVLIAYVKIRLFQRLLSSPLPDEPFVVNELRGYFPSALRERYAGLMSAHRLAREIVGTVVANEMVNRCGITFAFRLGEETGADDADIARAYLVAREVYGMRGTWEAIEALDNAVGADVQTSMLLETRKLVERGARWLLRNRPRPLDIARDIGHFAERGDRASPPTEGVSWPIRAVPRSTPRRLGSSGAAFPRSWRWRLRAATTCSPRWTWSRSPRARRSRSRRRHAVYFALGESSRPALVAGSDRGAAPRQPLAGVVARRAPRRSVRAVERADPGFAAASTPARRPRPNEWRHGWSGTGSRWPGAGTSSAIWRVRTERTSRCCRSRWERFAPCVRGSERLGFVLSPSMRRGTLQRLRREVGEPRTLAAHQRHVAAVGPLLEPVDDVGKSRRRLRQPRACRSVSRCRGTPSWSPVRRG